MRCQINLLFPGNFKIELSDLNVGFFSEVPICTMYNNRYDYYVWIWNLDNNSVKYNLTNLELKSQHHGLL